jgi:hypothetical protein
MLHPSCHDEIMMEGERRWNLGEMLKAATTAWISNFEEALAKAIAQIILARQWEPASK